MAKKKYYNGGAPVKQVDNNRCNLPQEVIVKDVGHIPAGGIDDYNDTMEGVDRRAREDDAGNNRKGKAGRW